MSEAGGWAALGRPTTATEHPDTSSSAAVAMSATATRRREEAGMSLGSSHRCSAVAPGAAAATPTTAGRGRRRWPAPPRGSALVHEPDGAQRGRREGRREGLAVPRLLDGLDTAHVADAGAAVALGVAVEHLAPEAGPRQADAVAVVRVAREVRDAGQRLGTCVRAVPGPRRAGVAQEGQHVARGVVGVDPLEAGGVDILG